MLDEIILCKRIQIVLLEISRFLSKDDTQELFKWLDSKLN